MKAVQLHGYGDIDRFRLAEIDIPSPGAGEALVKIEAAGLNPVDEHIRLGWMAQYVPLAFPAVIGVDAAGTVAAVGDGVSGFAVGDRVIAHVPLNGKGAFAERAVVPVAGLARLPANVAFTTGATLPLAGLTGRQAVDALEVGPGDRVLVAGALGAVGRVAVQYLKEQGAVPVAGVRAERLEEGRQLTGEAIDVTVPAVEPVFDYAVSAAAPVAANIVTFVRNGGAVASTVMTPEEANPGGRVNVVQVVGHDDPIVLHRIAEVAGSGALAIPIAGTFRLDELALAQQALAAGPGGKIVVLP